MQNQQFTFAELSVLKTSLPDVYYSLLGFTGKNISTFAENIRKLQLDNKPLTLTTSESERLYSYYDECFTMFVEEDLREYYEDLTFILDFLSEKVGNVEKKSDNLL